MKNILVVAERCSSFFEEKVLRKITEALVIKGFNSFVLVGEGCTLKEGEKLKVFDSYDFKHFSSVNEEHRFTLALETAKSIDANQIHFVRLIDPQKLLLALLAHGTSSARITALEFGFPRFFRFPTYEYACRQLLMRNDFSRLTIQSIFPDAMREIVNKCELPNPQKVKHLHEIPEMQISGDYTTEKGNARTQLGLPHDKVIVLYFGRSYFSKGPDLFLQSAKDLSSKENLFFIFAGNAGITTFNFDLPSNNSANLNIDNRDIPNDVAALYFSAADIVCLPYRRAYAFNTSGVLLQACMAGTAVACPDITPFKELVEQYQIGMTFKCEDQSSLNEAILSISKKVDSYLKENFNAYLDKIESTEEYCNSVLF